MTDDSSISIEARSKRLFDQHSNKIHCRTDRIFVRLMPAQWAAAIFVALLISPKTWSGSTSNVHVHVWGALLLGGLITIVPMVVAKRHPGTAFSRHSIAVGQSLMSALLIHLSGGRIETHFHVFGSLAFLAFYRDWKVLVTASAVTAVDHFVRGIFWPESVFGVITASHWRWLEHAGWVVFEDFFLLRSCMFSLVEMREIATRQARLEETNSIVENEVRARTAELRTANQILEEEVKERARAEAQRDDLSVQLLHAHKLEAIGQLAAGIAHEINTPTQYVGDNTRFLEESFRDLEPVLEKAKRLVDELPEGEAPDRARELRTAIADADLEYLSEEIPRAIEQSLSGVERVRKIVQSMREFSHPSAGIVSDEDLNRALDNTITVASNEWKYVAEVETDFDPTLPPVPCRPDELNQVLLNVIVNAAHAIADVIKDGDGDKGTITISTRHDGDYAEVRIADSGAGIPEEIRHRVFDPFFTTKEVGKGTGQGLSIAHTVIVKDHGGVIDFESETGAGTTFIIRLPLRPVDVEAAVA